jgi:hypothetical protein
MQALLDFSPFLYLALFTAGGLPAARRDVGSFFLAEGARRIATDWLMPLALRWLRSRALARAGGGVFGGGGAGGGRTAKGRTAGGAGAEEGSGSDAACVEGSSSSSSGARRRRQGRQPYANGAGGSPEGGSGGAGGGGPAAALLRLAAADTARPPLPDGGSMFEDVAALVRDTGLAAVFASALPLGPLLCLGLTALRLRLDALKLLDGCRRPAPRRAAGVGKSWRAVIACQVRQTARARRQA